MAEFQSFMDRHRADIEWEARWLPWGFMDRLLRRTQPVSFAERAATLLPEYEDGLEYLQKYDEGGAERE